MTTTQLITLVRAKILEAEDNIVTDATLLIYANWSYKDIIKKVFPNSAIKSATVNFVNGVGSLPADFGTLYTDAVDTNLNVYPELSISDFARNGNLGNGLAVEGGTLKVSPLSVASLPIKYYPTFAALSASSDPAFNEYFEEPILYGMMYRAYEDLQDVELSKEFKQKYDDMIKERISVLSNYEEDAQRGGVMFNGLSIIGNNGPSNDPNHW